MHLQTQDQVPTKAIAALAALYIVLYHLSGELFTNEWIGGVASIVFLPAFVRLLGYLLIGLWTIPALFVAALFCVDLGLEPTEITLVSACLALGGPLGAEITRMICGIDPDLERLSSLNLLQLSLGCSLGNAIFYNLAVWLVGLEPNPAVTVLATAAGDMAGTWIVCYAIKFVLTIWGRSLRR